jgi:hypothetical protein
MYYVEIRPGIKVSCEQPEEAIALAEILSDARRELEYRLRLEQRSAKRKTAKK